MQESSYAATPLVTVVIPCRNEEQSIGHCLDSVTSQTVTDTEILVVDGRSTDATREIVSGRADRDPRIQLLDNPKGIVPTALNIALDQAKGKWLVRVDAHCTISTDYIERLVKILETGVGGAGGRKKGVGKTNTGKAIALAMSNKAGVGGSYHHAKTVQTVEHVPFGAYPVDLARQVGGWNEKLSVNQDFEFDVRIRAAGQELVIDPTIVIDWECRQTFEALFRQYYRYGRGKTRVLQLHPGSFSARHLVAPMFLVAIAAVVMPWRWKYLSAARRALAGSSAAAVTVVGLSTARPLPLHHRWRVMAAMVVMQVSWGMGFWHGVADLLVGRNDKAIVDSDRLRPSSADG